MTSGSDLADFGRADGASESASRLLSLLFRHEESEETRVRAWQALLERYHGLLLYVAKSFGRRHDETMDYYTEIISELRHNDFQRLRRYAASDRAQFKTWLVVVARRICLDYRRQRYGRLTSQSSDVTDQASVRRTLVDHIVEDIDEIQVPDPAGSDPETACLTADLHERLQAALARLPTRDRLTLTLRFVDDLPARKIAATLRYPTPWHVYRRITSVLARLRRELETDGIDEPRP